MPLFTSLQSISQCHAFTLKLISECPYHEKACKRGKETDQAAANISVGACYHVEWLSPILTSELPETEKITSGQGNFPSMFLGTGHLPKLMAAIYINPEPLLLQAGVSHASKH
ncbi:hypothetical protein VNO77_29391 [Canavalia gladiata]|uniref:Uncharacterized protein n=1 Tax=Canavalia gladiata TaxID=3824 RepID=A0AAN9Q7U0_CANGL